MTENSEFYCVICGNKGVPISRKGYTARKSGHLKKLYCLNCQKETNHAECRELTHYSYKDFKFEFENNNFDNNGNRIKTYGEFRSDMNKKGVELP